MKFDLAYLFFAAVTVIGLIQWGKAILAAVLEGGWKWVTPLMIPPVAFLVAAVGGGGLNQVLVTFGVIWAIVQLCWDLIIKGIYAVVRAMVVKLGGKDPSVEQAMEVLTKVGVIVPPIPPTPPATAPPSGS